MTAKVKSMNAEGIYATLRSEIVGGALPPGTALREVAVAARFGVSRTPIREVLRRLLHDGLLERASTGLQVVTNSVERTIQVYDLRILLEGQVAVEAAETRRAADLLLLHRLLEHDRSLVDPPIALRVQSNLEFHNAIWDAAHNTVLRDILGRLAMHGVSAPQTTLDDDARWVQSLDEHEALIRAIEERDVVSAKRIAEQHIAEAKELRIRILTRYTAPAE